MRKAVKVILSVGWIAVFGVLAIVSLVAAVDGIAAARDAFPFVAPLLAIEPLATQPVMGGLSLGSALVTALFSWMLLTTLIVEDNPSRGADNPVELAHGGAFGIVGLVFLAAILDTSFPLMAGAGLMVAALVFSLLLSRTAPEPKPALAPRWVRDRAIEAAHLYSADMRRPSAEIVHFPLRGSIAREGR